LGPGSGLVLFVRDSFHPVNLGGRPYHPTSESAGMANRLIEPVQPLGDSDTRYTDTCKLRHLSE